MLLNLPEIYSDTIFETHENPIGLNRRAKMGIENLSEDVVLVTLSAEPQAGHELKAVNEILSNKGDCDVVVDFSGVETIVSSSVSNLIILRELLRKRRRRLILCNVAVLTKCIFTVAGLDTIFKFVDDKPAALAAVKRAD